MKWFFIIMPLYFACTGTRRHANQQNPMNFDKQGHRGCRGLLPENTIPAMIRALELGVTTLEMDVVITKDRQVVLSHEPWMGHEIVTTPEGKAIEAAKEKTYNIYRMDYAEVRTFDAGLKPHPRFPGQKKMAAVKPLLRDVIDSVRAWCERHNKPLPYFNIETKCLPPGDGIFHPAPAPFCDLLMQVITEKNIFAQSIIQSFDFRTLQYLHQKYPALATAILIEDHDKRSAAQWLSALGYTPAICSPHYTLVNKELLAFCRGKGMRLIPWTVNTKEEIERLRNLGVDGIISDYPDLF
jgi:glycerophosphoryl diester phosphodiesterase